MPLSMTRTTARPSCSSALTSMRPCGGVIFRRVVQQVGEHLREPDGIGIENELVRRQLDRQAVLLRVDQRAAGLDGLPDDFVERRQLPC